MKLAFCLFKYFPYGGLQRDFLRIAQVSQSRGHEVYVYTMQWEGEKPANLHINIVPIAKLQNHTRTKAFIAWLKNEFTQQKYDLIIGFNKMPMLDVYYAADVCYQAKTQTKNFLQRALPRHRHWLNLEKTLFKRGDLTEILLISPREQQAFQYYYQTEPHRFHHLPPGISKDFNYPNNAAEIRSNMRKQLLEHDGQVILLQVGSGFKTKGLDRSIKAVAALPISLKQKCKLLVVGKDNALSFLRLAKRLGVNKQIEFLGARDDVPALLLAADLLLHPAYHENTGTILVEALACGLPVLTVDVCGYASYIQAANAGTVMPSPFQQTDFNITLEKMVLSPQKAYWRNNALTFAKQNDFYSLPEKAVNFIEHVGRERAFLFTR